MDKIQNTYKPYKLVLMNSSHKHKDVYFEAQKSKQYFLKSKLFYENTYKFCVCVYELEQFTTNLSLYFI